MRELNNQSWVQFLLRPAPRSRPIEFGSTLNAVAVVHEYRPTNLRLYESETHATKKMY